MIRLILFFQGLLIALSFYSFPTWGEVALGETSPVASAVKGLVISLPVVHFTLAILAGNRISRRPIQFEFSQNKYFVLFVCLAVASVAWSPNRGQSLLRILSFAMINLSIICYCILRLLRNPETAWSILIRDTQLALLISQALILVLALVAPAYAFSYTEQRLGGDLIHPNTLGAYAMVSIIISLYSLSVSSQKTVIAWLTLALATAVLLISFSRTAIIVTAICSALFLYLSLSSSKPTAKRNLIRATFSLLVTACIFYVSINFFYLLDLISRGDSFYNLITASSRTLIWASLFKSLGYSAIFGHGYSMITPNGPLLFYNNFSSYHAHNGYLQVLCGVGIIGLALFLAQLILYTRKIMSYRQTRPNASALAICLLAALSLHNIGQSGIGYQIYPQLYFTLLVVNMFLLTAKYSSLIKIEGL